MRFIVSLLVLFSSTSFALVFKPDPTKTPGAYCSPTDRDFLEYRYAEGIAICGRSVSVSLKNEVYTMYRVPPSERTEYTIDHRLPLFLGGNNSKENLWPQPKVVTTTKLEGQIYILLRDGVLTQGQSVKLILSQKQ